MANNTLQVETVPIDSVSQDPANAMKHPDRNIETIAGSLRRFGQRKPIVVDKQNVIRAGNGTWQAAKSIGWTDIDIVRTELEGTEATAYAIADNRSSQLAEWDNDVLAELLGSFDEELQQTIGFDEDDLKDILPEPEDGELEDTEPQIDRAEELQKEWGTETGQLWLIGEHRLLCGDSTKEEVVKRVMFSNRAGLMNTDPPYGVSYANDERPNPGVAKPRVAKPRVANDTMRDEELQVFLTSAFHLASEYALLKNAAWYMWHAHLTQGYFAAAAAAAANVVLHRQIIWVKPVLLLGRGQYHWKHEPCFMGWVQGNKPPDYGLGNGERTQTTVWEVESVSHTERKDYNHSTPKPVGLFSTPIIKHLKLGEVCYEPFAGSGPQFVAAQNLNRRCYGIEISPAYCAVILQRMKDTFPDLEVKKEA